MQIHFIRNASLIVTAQDHAIVVDPMLSGKGALPPLSIFRHKAARNPLVPLPDNTEAALEKVNAALITHCRRGHVDHLDLKGRRFLRDRQVPTYCRTGDERYLRKRGVDAHALTSEERQPFLDGAITLIPARHGHGWISSVMGPGVGYVLELPGEPSLYIAGDTVMTDDVRRALTEMKPDVAIVAAGNASVDVGKPILMQLEEVIEFATLAPGRVVANHLEALNHCPITREQVADAARAANLDKPLEIPLDGETMSF